MISFITAVITALIATPCVIWMTSRWEMIDIPNERSSHVVPVPRGGGIALAFAALLAFALSSEWSRETTTLVVGATTLGLVGLVDDRFGLSAGPRLLAQLLVPAVAAMLVVDRSSATLLIAVVVAVVCCAAYVNAFNFMDGINGISGSQAAIAGLLLAAAARHDDVQSVAALGLSVSGAALGFLPFNAPRAFIFLGDVGSYFVGFWLAGSALLAVDAGLPVLVVLAPFVLYLLDTGAVLVRRGLRGERLTQAHREHVYQRLVQGGMSHTASASICAASTAISSVAMLAVIDSSFAVQAATFSICLALGVVYLALPTLVGRWTAKEAAA